MTAGTLEPTRLRPGSPWVGRGLVILALLLGVGAFVIIARMGTGPTSGTPAATGKVVASQLPPALVDGVDNHGQVLFGRYCDSCHPGAGSGIGADLRSAQSHRQYATEDSIIRLVRAGGFDMPAFSQQMLADDDLAQIASYVRSLPAESP